MNYKFEKTKDLTKTVLFGKWIQEKDIIKLVQEMDHDSLDEIITDVAKKCQMMRLIKSRLNFSSSL